MLVEMSAHARSRTYPCEESLLKKFQKLHRVSGLEVMIGVLLMKRFKAGEESIRD